MIRAPENREIWLPMVEELTELKLSGGAPVAEKLLPRLRERKQERDADHKQSGKCEKPNDLRAEACAPADPK